jgi:predicted acylesterase/phospholipase RssA
MGLIRFLFLAHRNASTGLCLSGGGCTRFAHIGVMQSLEITEYILNTCNTIRAP